MHNSPSPWGDNNDGVYYLKTKKVLQTDKSQLKRVSIHKQNNPSLEHKFGHTTLKFFIILLCISVGCGVVAQALHAPPTRIFYLDDGTYFSAIKLLPSRIDSSSPQMAPSLFVFNDLGFPAESGKVLGNYFAGRGMSVFLFDYFASPLTIDPSFNFTRYFQKFTQELINTGQINASNIYFVGFGLGATCALTLAEALPPRALVSVNAVSNFSRILSWINQAPLDSLEVVQSRYWAIQLQNYGCLNTFQGLDGFQLDQFIPTLHTTRLQANSTLLIQTFGDPACIPLDQDELRERLHCETWLMAGDGKNALIDAQFHSNVAEWLQGQGLALRNTEQSITIWMDVTYVTATGFLLGIVCILMIRYLKIKREDQDLLSPIGSPNTWEIGVLISSVAGVISLIFAWGNIQTAIEISGGILGIQLVIFCIYWKKGKYFLNTKNFEEPKTPWRDALVTTGIYGALLILSLTLFEPVIVPRGRNFPFLLLLGFEWGGLYLLNLTSSVRGKVRRGRKLDRLLEIGPALYGSILFIDEFVVLYNPILLNLYPVITCFLITFIFIIFTIPKFASKLDYTPLILTIALTCVLF